MDRRFGLVAVWALFAAAAIGVGFGAAGLVGDPFTDGVSPVPVEAAGDAGSPAPDPSSDTPSPASPSATGSTAPEVTRNLQTRAGLVFATCRGGVVRLGASPLPGWEVDDLDEDADESGRVRFERSGDGDGRVDVKVECGSGRPVFAVDDDADDDGGDDGRD